MKWLKFEEKWWLLFFVELSSGQHLPSRVPKNLRFLLDVFVRARFFAWGLWSSVLSGGHRADQFAPDVSQESVAFRSAHHWQMKDRSQKEEQKGVFREGWLNRAMQFDCRGLAVSFDRKQQKFFEGCRLWQFQLEERRIPLHLESDLLNDAFEKSVRYLIDGWLPVDCFYLGHFFHRWHLSQCCTI